MLNHEFSMITSNSIIEVKTSVDGVYLYIDNQEYNCMMSDPMLDVYDYILEKNIKVVIFSDKEYQEMMINQLEIRFSNDDLQENQYQSLLEIFKKSILIKEVF